MSRKELILGTIVNSVANLMYYDRKEDEDLPHGEIEEAIQSGEITIDEMTEQFKTQITKISEK